MPGPTRRVQQCDLNEVLSEGYRMRMHLSVYAVAVLASVSCLRNVAGQATLYVDENAAGTYRPSSPGGERTATFRMRNGLAVLGGFAGEEPGAHLRDPAAHETVLSGDLDGDDPSFSDCCFSNDTPGCDDAGCRAAICDQDPFCCQVSWDVYCAVDAADACPAVCGLRSDNSFHVVTTGGTDRSAVLDGFTIADGYADEFLNNRGGGVHNMEGSPVLARCTLTHNTANFGGGSSANNHPVLVNCSFILNYGSGAALEFAPMGEGGGMWVNGPATRSWWTPAARTVFWAPPTTTCGYRPTLRASMREITQPFRPTWPISTTTTIRPSLRR